jgi:hypothetical protein
MQAADLFKMPSRNSVIGFRLSIEDSIVVILRQEVCRAAAIANAFFCVFAELVGWLLCSWGCGQGFTLLLWLIGWFAFESAETGICDIAGFEESILAVRDVAFSNHLSLEFEISDEEDQRQNDFSTHSLLITINPPSPPLYRTIPPNLSLSKRLSMLDPLPYHPRLTLGSRVTHKGKGVCVFVA